MSRNGKDALGDELKIYEKVETGRKIDASFPIVVRIDGRSFSNFTRSMKRPFDEDMSDVMVSVTKYLVKETHAVVGYTQSDEITLILYVDKDANPLASHMFDGRVQKLMSVIAGMTSARFSLMAVKFWPDLVYAKTPAFDCRVFGVPSLDEAIRVLQWREIDARKNSVSMLARAFFSARELDGKKSGEMRDMLKTKGIDYWSYPEKFRRGTYVKRRCVERNLTLEELANIPVANRPSGSVMRTDIEVMNVPAFFKIDNPVDVFIFGSDVIERPNDLFTAKQSF